MANYQSITKKQKLYRGTVELFAQQWSIHTLAKDGRIDHLDTIVAPQFLADGKASTMMTAINKAYPELDVPGIAALSKQVALVFLMDLPDSCPATVRQRSWVKQQYIENPNIVTNPIPGCCVHALHNVMEASVREEDFTGDLHAIMITHTHVHQHCKILNQFYQMLAEPDGFAWVQDVAPNPAWASHTRAILMETVGRDVRGRLESDWSCLSEPQALADTHRKIDFVCKMVNCDARPGLLRKARWIHYELGCGQCKDEATARTNFGMAMEQGGLIVNMAGTVPNSAGWDTTHDAFSEVLPGI
jgi:hypothetical protein